MTAKYDTPIRLAIVGHVDHGKSTLIGRLLLDTDSLPEEAQNHIRLLSQSPGNELVLASITDHLGEERAQARTIDTTQAVFTHAGRRYVVIDTPGHAEFVRNMFTGASRADAALLVVDAAEGVRGQTLAHCRVLAMLGIERVIPVVNKMDLVDYDRHRFDQIAAEVAQQVQALGLKSTIPAVPISAFHGDNVASHSSHMSWYAGASLLEALEVVPSPAAALDLPLRYAVQDVYSVNGRRIYVGRVEAGRCAAYSRVTVLPGHSDNTILSIEAFMQQRLLAQAGQSVGVTLARPLESPKGAILCDPKRPPASSRELAGWLFWLDEQPLAKGESLQVRIATQEVMVQVQEISQRVAANSTAPPEAQAESLDYGQIGCVRLAAQSPLVREPLARSDPLSRFVLARAGNVCGAGRVIQ